MMPSETPEEVRPALDWTFLLDLAAREMAAAALAGCPEGDSDGPRYAADFVMATAGEATRPESEVPTLGMATLEDGSRVEYTTPPGYLRRAFEGFVGDWTDSATAARILDVVRAAIAAELDLDPDRLAPASTAAATS